MLLTRIKVLFCLFLYTGEVCYLIPQTPCTGILRVITDNEPDGIENATHTTFPKKAGY
jgi:hypothetical protein